MNAKKLIMISGLALASAMFAGCEDRTNDTATDATTDATHVPADAPLNTTPAREGAAGTYAAPAAGAYTDERRDAFVESAEKQYDALEEELAALAAEAEAKGDPIKARFNTMRPSLESQLKAVGERLDSVKDANASTWTQLEGAYTKAVNDVRAAFAQARQSLLGAPAPQPTNPPSNRPTSPPTTPPANPPANPPR